jgi:hypothetical protein
MQWKISLIDTIFMHVEAQRIKYIPLSQPIREDSLIWVGTPHGRFTIQSALKLLEEVQHKEGGSMSNPRRAGTFWTDVWQVFMPHKIRVFMWRACSTLHCLQKQSCSNEGLFHPLHAPYVINILKQKNIFYGTVLMLERCGKLP